MSKPSNNPKVEFFICDDPISNDNPTKEQIKARDEMYKELVNKPFKKGKIYIAGGRVHEIELSKNNFK